MHKFTNLKFFFKQVPFFGTATGSKDRSAELAGKPGQILGLTKERKVASYVEITSVRPRLNSLMLMKIGVWVFLLQRLVRPA